jgi:uncharacterized protein
VNSAPRLAILFALLLGATPLAALPLWTVEGAQGTVLLLGSVHLLRESDQPLPQGVSAAYGNAQRVVLELDPRELAPAVSQAALERVGVMWPGRSVAELLDAEQWRRAETLAAGAGLDLHAVAGFEPWFAAIALYNRALLANGFDPRLGVDQQIAGWAARDGKPVDGLETLEAQLSMFKELPQATQVELLLKTLEEVGEMDAEAGRMIEAWRTGDLARLAGWLEEDFAGFEALRSRIVEDRNRAWLADIEALLEREGTSLVVVGALHLVGPDGVPELLSARGHRVRPHAAPAGAGGGEER